MPIVRSCTCTWMCMYFAVCRESKFFSRLHWLCWRWVSKHATCTLNGCMLAQVVASCALSVAAICMYMYAVACDDVIVIPVWTHTVTVWWAKPSEALYMCMYMYMYMYSQTCAWWSLYRAVTCLFKFQVAKLHTLHTFVGALSDLHRQMISNSANPWGQTEMVPKLYSMLYM